MNGVTIGGLAGVLKALPNTPTVRAATMRILQRCALRIVVEAQALVPQTSRALFRSIRILAINRETLQVAVGSDLTYAIFVESGTGVFGPNGAPITPTNGPFMSWPSSNVRQTGTARASGSDYAFATQIAGQEGIHFFERGIENARSKFPAEVIAGTRGLFEGNTSES